jgi:BirA family biotin operon repressor/biotin-[acetyl-CoA-carboxylase] ligase
MTGGAIELPPPFRLIAYQAIGSTNDEAKRLARGGAGEGLIVWAKNQTAGRGRRGRVWVSSSGNLYFSLVLRPRCRVTVAAQLGFVAAVALAGAIGELAPNIEFRCKWPNDLLANGKKLSGILLETEMVAGDRPDFVVIGIGVNLAASPRDVAYAATSLAEEGATGVVPEITLVRFVEHFGGWLALWRDEGFGPIRDIWLKQAAGIGDPIQVRLARETLVGRFIDLDGDGTLVLGMPSGNRRIAAGEIFPVTA